jgi:thiamine biosynthesis lipoprotein
MYSADFEAIGTRWKIDVFDEVAAEPAQKIVEKIKARIDVFDRAYSRFRADSLVTEMSHKAGEYVLPNDAKPMFDLYLDLYQRTNGLFTPLIAQTLVEAGYDAQYSLEPKELHRPPTWNEALDYKFPMLTLKRPALLDVGAAGKGYIIDIVSQILYTEGVTAFCVDAGADIFYAHPTNKLLEVGLENPLDATEVVGVATIANESICGSAGNRRAWKNFHHIIDPRTLTSPRNILAVWTIADTTMLADGLSTCLFFVPSKTLAPHYDFEYVILYEDFSIEKSAYFPGKFFK